MGPSPGPIEAALDLLKQSVEQKAIIIGIGPFTNLSLLERSYPGILRHAKLYLMGGQIRPAPATFPAWSQEMDYNVQADGSAAKHVLESARPTLVPIEVTVQTALRRSHLRALYKAGPLGELIARQAEAFADDWNNEERYGRAHSGLPRDITNFQHDPLTCAIALGWSGVTVETLPLTLEMDGDWLRQDIDRQGRPLPVVTGIEREKFNAFWLNTVAGHPA